MNILHSIPVTASFRGAGNNAYELVEKKDSEGNVELVRELVHNASEISITRNINYADLHNNVPHALKKRFIRKGKLDKSSWKKFLKENQDRIIQLNCQDYFWDLPEVHGGKVEVIFTIG